MSLELAATIVMGVALAGLALVSIREHRAEMKAMRAEIKELRGEIKELRERMARIEGMFEGFLRRESRQAREPRRESETAAGVR